MRRSLLALLAPAVLIGGCNGPNERAGQEKDKAAAAAAGVPYNGDGPNERIGEAQDRTAAATRKAQKAEASALRQQAGELKTEADVQADRLEQQARELRERARDRAAPLQAQAHRIQSQH